MSWMAPIVVGVASASATVIQSKQDIGIEPSKATDNVTYVAYPDYLTWSPAAFLNNPPHQDAGKLPW